MTHILKKGECGQNVNCLLTHIEYIFLYHVSIRLVLQPKELFDYVITESHMAARLDQLGMGA